MREDKDRLRAPCGGALFISRPLLLAASALLAWGAAERRAVVLWVGGALLAFSVVVAALVGFAEARHKWRQSRVRCG